MNQTDDHTDEPALVRNRSMDIVVALLLLVGSAIVIFDSAQIGYGWLEGQGPAPGYFTYYVALALAIASSINLLNAALRSGPDGAESFVSRVAFGRVLSVLVPTAIYVGLIQYLGIYLASAIFIIAFMLYFGRESILRSLLVGAGVPLALFFMFERWFLVPLPKGPIEAMLGF